MRNTCILGVAIPFALGFVGLLSEAGCFIALWGLLIVRFTAMRYRAIGFMRRQSRRDDAAVAPPKRRHSAGVLFEAERRRGISPLEVIAATALPVVATTAVAWPALVRPMLQGDSLGYHLPNAAAWVHAHSIWATTTWYWWFAGGSELFASGLLAVAGPLALGFAGTAPLLLLGLRIFLWSREEGTRPWVAGAVAALGLSSFVLAEQAGSLENDVWLAAFFLESLWLLRHSEFTRVGASRMPHDPALASAIGSSPSRDPTLARLPNAISAVATTTVIKTTGWLYALIALALGRLPAGIAALSFAPLILWLIRDAILWPNATIPGSTVFYSHPFATTILAHSLSGLVTLAQALVHDGPATVLLFVGALVTIALAAEIRLRIAALAALAIFLLHPFGFNNANPQLAGGTSLRLAAPFLALGGLFIGELGKRVPFVVGPIVLMLAGFGLARVVNVFSADITSHGTLWVVILVAIVSLSSLIAYTRQVFHLALLRIATMTALALIAYAVVLAGSHPIDYYEDWLGHGTHRSTFFHWLAAHKPQAVVGYGLRVGSIVVLSPTTSAIDPLLDDPCAEARRLGAVLVIANDVPGPPPDHAAQRQLGQVCGHIIFDDGATLVVEPKMR